MSGCDRDGLCEFMRNGGDQLSHCADPAGMGKIRPELFGTFAILNVGRRTVPFHDLSSLVSQWHGAAQKPSILPVGAADAHLLLERLTTCTACTQSSCNSILIFGMNRDCRTFLPVSELRQAGIVNHASIAKLNSPIGPSDPDHCRNGLYGFAKFTFLFPQLLHSESIQPPKECQKRSYAQRAEPNRLVPGGRDDEVQQCAGVIPNAMAVACSHSKTVVSGFKVGIEGLPPRPSILPFPVPVLQHVAEANFLGDRKTGCGVVNFEIATQGRDFDR